MVVKPSQNEPDIERLLRAFYHERTDIVPNFEILMNSRFISMMGREVYIYL